MDQLPRLGKRELICLLLSTCNYVVFVWRGFLFLWVLGMGYVILLWHSLSLPYNYFVCPLYRKEATFLGVFSFSKIIWKQFWYASSVYMEPGHKMVTDLKLPPYRPNTSPQVNVFQSLIWRMFCNKCLFTAAFLFKAPFPITY